MKIILIVILLFFQENCLFKNPLCFYDGDILTYVKVLHKQQMYDLIIPFLYGPYIDSIPKHELHTMLSDGQIGYDLRRVGVREISTNNWSLTYQRIIIGTSETFTINCSLINDTCRIYIDDSSWRNIFHR